MILYLWQGMSIPHFGTWSFHVDALDLGTQKKSLRTPVFTLSERFARSYNLKNPKRPAGISGSVPVRDLNVLAIAAASGHSRDNVAAALKDIFLYVGEQALSGAPVRLDFGAVGTFYCAGGAWRFSFSPRYQGTFEIVERPGTAYGVLPPTPSVFARMRPRSSGFAQRSKPPTPLLADRPRTSSRPPTGAGPRPGSRGGRLGSAGPGAGAALDASQALPMVHGGAGGEARPSSGTGARAVADEAQVYVLREPELDVAKVEVVVRDKELLVRQADIGFERVYPLHARADAERITARYKRGALEITVPDKASLMRAYYQEQIRERDRIRAIEQGEDQALIEMNAGKADAAIELERQAVEARRRQRAEIEAFNRTQARLPKDDLFSKPLECGYLLYNRREEEGKGLSPGELRKILDTQVSVKKTLAAQEKELERVAMMSESAQLKEELAAEERKVVEDKREAQRARMRQLDEQMAEKVQRVNGVFSAVCNFPRLDGDAEAAAQNREKLRKLQEEVHADVQARGKKRLEERRSEYEQEMADLMDVMQALDEEQEEAQRSMSVRKEQNRRTWQAQMRVKREAVNAEIGEPLYATSLKIGENDAKLERTIRPTDEEEA